MELRHLRYFVAVAEELSFTRAAARLHTSQPSLSQQIRHLEAEVGVTLLERTRHRVALTDAGRVYLREARDVLSRVTHAAHLAHQAAEGRAGDLSVGTFPAADVKILPTLRAHLATRLPNVRLVLHSKYAVEPIAGLRQGTLDTAFLRGPLAEDDLEVVELLQERIVVVLPAHHPLARKKRIPVRLLNDLPCITMARPLAPALHDSIAALYRQARIRMHAVLDADNVLGHLNLVQGGLGFALLPDYVGAILPPGVVMKPLDWAPAPTVSIVLAWKKGHRSGAVRAFVDLVRDCCAGPADVRHLTARPRKS